MTRPTILLTGCGGAPAQNVLWGLRHGGSRYRVVGVECDPYRIHLTTGFEARHLVPRCDHPDYLERLNSVIDEERVDLVHAQPDPEVGMLSAHRDEVDARVSLPSDPVVRLCHDKFQLLARLREAGLGVARSTILEDEDGVARALQELGPTVWIRAIRGAAGAGSLPVTEVEHARAWVDYCGGWGRFVAEEFLPGRNLAWQAVYLGGELQASISWERLHYVLPSVAPSGITGTPAVARLTDEDAVHEIGRRAVSAVDPSPHGVYGVDFKESADGEPYVTEINPGRFFQPNFMFASGGYNIVRRYFDLVLDHPAPCELPVRARHVAGQTWLRGLDAAPVMRSIDVGGEAG